ncbi:Hypothetical predicted protein [Mytilus galloprovincialis]|uniref:B box-type domain-containing protein n=1 Tax=Mytilus galloprovincialis TaxID=29158 RepID=A0A8B6BQA0_MYTGA|nr:Hypothetical predicted protein [Mytilus galloprovincialis]
MALSGSLGKGQTPIICQFCENETKITNKCLDCNLLMCENCSVKLHPKVNGAGDHTIVNIKSLGSQHSVDFKDFSSIKCEEHPKQVACLFCNTCKQAVCPGCVSKVHKQHNIEEFQNLYQLKVERLQCGIGKVDIDCKELERRSQHLEHLKTMETTRLSNMHKTLLTRQHL